MNPVGMPEISGRPTKFTHPAGLSEGVGGSDGCMSPKRLISVNSVLPTVQRGWLAVVPSWRMILLLYSV